jgi:hypothetical protein
MPRSSIREPKMRKPTINVKDKGWRPPRRFENTSVSRSEGGVIFELKNHRGPLFRVRNTAHL